MLEAACAALWLFAAYLGYRVMIAPLLAKPRAYVDHIEPEPHPSAIWPGMRAWFGRAYGDV